MSRTVRLVHREAEASMIATQLLLCQGALAMPAPKKDNLPVMCSPRRVLLEARRDIAGQSNSREPFTERITRAQRERRVRTTAKQKREWPRRKDHKPPQPPILLRLTRAAKGLYSETLARQHKHANGDGIECHLRVIAFRAEIGEISYTVHVSHRVPLTVFVRGSATLPESSPKVIGGEWDCWLVQQCGGGYPLRVEGLCGALCTTVKPG